MSSNELCNLTEQHIPWSICHISTASQCNASSDNVSWCLQGRLERALDRGEGTTSQGRCKPACYLSQGWCSFSEASMEPKPPFRSDIRYQNSEVHCFKENSINFTCSFGDELGGWFTLWRRLCICKFWSRWKPWLQISQTYLSDSINVLGERATTSAPGSGYVKHTRPNVKQNSILTLKR